jgi:hypothetical protein
MWITDGYLGIGTILHRTSVAKNTYASSLARRDEGWKEWQQSFTITITMASAAGFHHHLLPS